MKVRFGVALGAATGLGELAGIVDTLEGGGVDSLWFPELVYSTAVDPMIGMAFAVSRTTRLKVGTSVAILPGRHPVLVAKQLVSLANLAPKRILPVFGLQSAHPTERQLFPVPGGTRGEVFDESLHLLRSVLAEDDVTFSGKHFQVDNVRLGGGTGLDIWLGGSAPGALRRVGTFGDGWLTSFITPDEARLGVQSIQDAAADAGREIEPDHFGMSLSVAEDGLSPELATAIRSRRPNVDPADLVADGWPELHRRLDAYVAAGLSKFVISPAGGGSTEKFVDRVISELVPRQN